MQIEPWRKLSDYADNNRQDLTRMLNEDAGVYLIARPQDTYRVSLKDIVYIGLAGEKINARGTFRQRIWSHKTKLTTGVQGTEGSLRSWRDYHGTHGGPGALNNHALRLIRMSASNAAEKRLIGEREDLLLLLWSQLCNSSVPPMPILNTKRPDRAGILALFEGTIEGVPEGLIGRPAPDEASKVLESLSELRESDDEGLEHDERLARFQTFFETRGLAETWNTLLAQALKRGLGYRVIALEVRADRPGQLRLCSARPGASRASNVLAIVSLDMTGHGARVKLRWPPERLSPRYETQARECLGADGRNRCSNLKISIADLNDLMIEAMNLALADE